MLKTKSTITSNLNKRFSAFILFLCCAIGSTGAWAESSTESDEYIIKIGCASLFMVMSNKDGTDKEMQDMLIQAASIFVVAVGERFPDTTEDQNMQAVSVMYDSIAALSPDEYEKFVQESFDFCVEQL